MFSQTLLPTLFSVLSIPLVAASPVPVHPETPGIVEISVPSPATSKTFSVLPNTCFTPDSPFFPEIDISVVEAPFCSSGETAVYHLYRHERCQGTSTVWLATEKRTFLIPDDRAMSLLFMCREDYRDVDVKDEFTLQEFDTEWIRRTKDAGKAAIDVLRLTQDDMEEEKMGMEEMKEVEDDEDEDDDEDPAHPPTRRPQNQGNPFVVLGLILLASLLILVFTIIKCVMQGKRLIDRAMVRIHPKFWKSSWSRVLTRLFYRSCMTLSRAGEPRDKLFLKVDSTALEKSIIMFPFINSHSIIFGIYHETRMHVIAIRTFLSSHQHDSNSVQRLGSKSGLLLPARAVQ
jgi:hypothetical protein